MDKEPYDRSLERLCGEIDMLRHLVLAMASEMPERAIHNIQDALAWSREVIDQDATRRPNDRRREYAAGAWDIATEAQEVLIQRIDEIAEGQRIRTIQPYPIPPEEQVDPSRGF